MYLLEWKSSKDKKPLIVKGCRQVGKTASILKFASENYTSVIYINFTLEPNYKTITVDGYSVDSIKKIITRINPNFNFIDNNTIIIFDELQEYPEIATSLKSFAIDGRYDVICSGSLLGINYKRIESNSVGYKTDYELMSMDFEEFLWAKGYKQDTLDDLLNHMIDLAPFNELDMKLFSELFLDFCLLGGMPAVVEDYIESNSFTNSLYTQRQLLQDYKEDIRKYAIGLDQTRVLNVYNNIANQLAKDNKKFQPSKIEKGARLKDYFGCVEWLNDAGLINICYCLNFPELPLRANYNSSKYKIYFRDTGLLVAMLDDESQEDLRVNKNLGVYKGALYENIIADALAKQGYDLFYYKREDSTLEEDFFIRTASEIIPIEVKATNGTSKSLTTLITSEKYQSISYGIKLCNNNIGYNGKFYTIPYFCTFLLKRYLAKIKH